MAGPDAIEARFEGSLGEFDLDVSFRAPMLGITAIFGPSGCGKTTILRCLAGLRHLPGQLRVGGQVWQDDSERIFRKPYQRSVGYVFQEASLFPHLSVRRNLLYGTQRRSRAQTQPVLGFDDVIDLLGIANLVERSPGDLSGGERQRVAIGRALLSQPRLLLMDEPLAGLDQGTKEEILPYLEALHQELSVPIVYVSHDIREVARLADTMIVLSRGRNVCSGSVHEVLERMDLDLGNDLYETGVVLRARVSDQDPSLRMTRLDHHGQEIVIPAADFRPGDEVRLRIRARDVALATAKPESISVRNILCGTVERVVEDPETAFAEVLVGIGGGRLRARVTRDAVDDLALVEGTPVFALVKSITFDRPAPGVSRSVRKAPDSLLPVATRTGQNDQCNERKSVCEMLRTGHETSRARMRSTAHKATPASRRTRISGVPSTAPMAANPIPPMAKRAMVRATRTNRQPTQPQQPDWRGCRG